MLISEPSTGRAGSLAVIFPFLKNETGSWKSWLKRLERITGNIPEKITGLRSFIRFVVEAIHPSRIYLLDNREAAGEERYHHLLVVTKGSESLPLPDFSPVFDMAYFNDQRVRCLFRDQGTVMQGLQDGHIFYSMHCRPEQLLYEDGLTDFPLTGPRELARLKNEALAGFRTSILIAKDFYQNAMFFTGRKASPVVAFFLHQAAELTYRSVLIALTGGCKKTHELIFLRQQSVIAAPRLCRFLRADTPEEKRLIGLLDQAYTGARYKADFVIDPDDLAGLTDEIAMLLEAAEEWVTARLSVDPAELGC